MSIHEFDRIVVNITVKSKSVSLIISKNRCNNFDSIWIVLYHHIYYKEITNKSNSNKRARREECPTDFSMKKIKI